MRFARTRHFFRRMCRGILQTRRLYTHVFLVSVSTVSAIEAALVHGSVAQPSWMAAAALSAASVTVVEGLAQGGAYRRWTVPRKLPELPSFFLGRSSDITSLSESFAEQRSARRTNRAGHRNDPVLIYIYGQPGIGKSALASVFARRIARYYPDGVLAANLGEVGVPRDSGEVLGSFLDELQSPASSLDTQRRADLFQDICARGKFLVILEAAQDASQIATLLPRNPGCAAIITSRRRIGGASSHLVQAPNTGEAVEMLYSYSGMPPNSCAESVAEIVEMCGRLPLALLSAGEQVANSRTFEDMARMLRPREERLARLDHGGHLIEERIRTEYERLGERDKKAFCRLALLQTATFLPWVLAPLLEVDLDEAANIITRLAEAQLIQIADHDPSGLKRYRLHPLMWCFAYSELRKDAGEAGAEIRLEDYRLNVITEVLIRIDPTLGERLTRRLDRGQSRSSDFDWLRRIAQTPSYWSRSEYGALVKGVDTSSRQSEWELCWRIATQLGSCVPRYLEPVYYLEYFDRALSAAETSQDEVGQIRVLLAKAESLVALERYSEAFAAWQVVDSRCSGMRTGEGAFPEIDSLLAARLRKEGEAWLQLGSYVNAKKAFDLALAKAVVACNSSEEELIDILMAENDTSRRLEHWQDDEVYQKAAQRDDSTRFRAYLGLSEAARRKGRWLEAYQFLEKALAPSYGDARRRASVEYRLGRLRLSQWRAESLAPSRAALATAAVGHSAIALVRFQSMDNFVGCVRARCLLARALIAAGQDSEAAAQIAHALEEATRISSIPASMRFSILSPCLARIDRAQGELLLGQGYFGDAQQHLEEAAGAFKELSDGWSRAEAMLLLGKACKGASQYTRAMSHLYEARVAFERCRDVVNLIETIREQARVARDQRKFAVAHDYSADVGRLEHEMKKSIRQDNPGSHIANVRIWTGRG